MDTTINTSNDSTRSDAEKLDPTINNQKSDFHKKKAGSVVYDTPVNENWNALDPKYGMGGSAEYPLRTTVESRIKSKETILKLRNPEVRIEPTNLCNYTCTMCPRETHDRPKGYMPMPFYKSLVDEVMLMGAQQITLVNFGEPFIDPTLEDKIHYATQNGLRTYLITNASLFHLPSRSDFAKSSGQKMTKIEAAIKAGLTEIRLSFYGATKDIYESVMVGGNFERTEANIKLASEMREKYGKEVVSPTTGEKMKSPEISMYFLEFSKDKSKNSKEMRDFLDYTRPFADYIEVWRPHNFGDGRNYRDIKVEKKSCGRPSSGPIQLNWKGIVVPCCYDYNEEIPLGNVAQQTVEEVLRGAPYEALRDSHNTKNFEKVPYCNDCDQLCERNDAIVVSTNPKHQNRDAEDIMKSPNTLAGFVME
jgi:MoaA/NifB/PqqE/SkfB family radical SAM enzyme